MPFVDKEGYRIVKVGGKNRREHRLVVEKNIGRKLKPFPKEVVHHKNGNKSDNRIQNLEIMSQSKHLQEHRTGAFKVSWETINVPTGKHLSRWNCFYNACLACGSKKLFGRSLCSKHYKSWNRWVKTKNGILYT